MKLPKITHALAAAIVPGGIVLAACQSAAAAPDSHTVQITAKLTVTNTAPPVCNAGVCVISNHGNGTLTPYGAVTFTTVVTADNNQPPCGPGSQWVNRIIRTISTSKGQLVLHEAGLLCPQPSVGPQVNAVWAADGADSTGIFAGAHGQGSDTAYPAKNIASPQGTLTLTH
jgi:hypothetical protein